MFAARYAFGDEIDKGSELTGREADRITLIRKRLRRQLLKRHRRNPKRLCRTRRWPNAYFRERGYRSLRMSHTAYVQSLEGPH